MEEEFVILKIEFANDVETNLEMLIIWLANPNLNVLNLIDLLKKGINPVEVKQFVFSRNSAIGKKILRNPQQILKLNLEDFEEKNLESEISKEKVKAFFHFEYCDMKTDIHDNTEEINVKCTFLCNKCKCDVFNIFPIQMLYRKSIGFDEFINLIKDVDIRCKFCGVIGSSSDVKKFKLVETKGLENDPVVSVSNYEKRKWFYNLDETVKALIELLIVIPNNMADIELYNFKFHLKLENISKHEELFIAIYFVDFIKLDDLTTFNKFDEFSIIIESRDFNMFKEELLIDPTMHKFYEYKSSLYIKM